MADATRRWRIATPAGLTWREWDGEFVVRDERTGNTHLLDARAGAVFANLIGADVALSVSEITLDLRDPSDGGVLEREIEAVLAALERIGLAAAEPT